MIRLEDLCKRFGPEGTPLAVNHVSLDVAAGELLILLGGSGSGKTTTLRMVNRLIEPTSGRVLIDGADASALPAFELRRKIGYAFQKIGLFPRMTVAENIGVTPKLLGWDAARIRARAEELLELVDLPPATYADRLPAELSGGQQQRVGVARALAAEAKVMLLDEPFGALDPVTRDRLQSEFTDIRKRIGLTAIFVTHDMTEALLLGDRIAVMHEGNLVQIGRPEELLKNPANDYVAELMSTPKRQMEQVEKLLEQSA